MRNDEVDDYDVWDPLWEFILDDYDESDTDDIKPRSHFSFRGEKKTEPRESREPPNFFDMLFDDEDDESEYDAGPSRGGWFENRDERSASRSRGSGRSSRWRSQLTENGGVDNSRWDLFRMEKRGSKANQTTTSEQTTSKQDSRWQEKNDQDRSQENANRKRRGFFNPFRRKKQLEEKQLDAEVENAEQAAIKERGTPQNENSSLVQETRPTGQARQQLKKEPKKKRVENVDDLDPFQMFLEVAEKLDPFGSDDDSDSDSSTADNESDSASESPSDIGTIASESLLGPPESLLDKQGREGPPTSNEVGEGAPLPSPQTVTEIRLNFQPIEEDNSSIVDDNESQPILQTNEEEPLTRENAIVRDVFPSDEVLDKNNPRAGRARDPVQPSRALSPRYRAPKTRNRLSKLACWSSHHRSKEVLHQLKIEDAKEVFPATRMVSNDNFQSSAVTGGGADYVNGVMGVPSDRFLNAKGPQSLYAYDYESAEHMDAFYPSVTAKPRSSVLVRKIGSPPGLGPSTIGHEVVLQVEASTVSESDCIIRQGGWWGSKEAPKGNTPGVDVVGKVFQIREKTRTMFGLKARHSVLSLVKWGGNSRYMVVPAEKLVKIPEGIDPAEAACLPETYLTAFQVLHFGQGGALRYKDSSLRGKSVLIVGSMANNMGKAIIELALNAGVANIYATAKKKHWKTLISFGIMPLSQEPAEWISRIEGTIDLVLAANGGMREEVTPIHYRALHPKDGKLILCGHRAAGNDVPVGDWDKRQANLICARNKALTRIMNRSYAYDVYEQWDRQLNLCKRDLEHLLRLHLSGAIKPKVLDRLPLSKVGRAQELIETKRLAGFLVCEPWMKSKKRAVYL